MSNISTVSQEKVTTAAQTATAATTHYEGTVATSLHSPQVCAC